MPAANVHQQRLMCQALAFREGKLSLADKTEENRNAIRNASKMSVEKLRDFCGSVKG